MKKILLATTFLVATTGFAAAEITFGGSAALGIARDGSADAVAASTDQAAIDAADQAIADALAAFEALPSGVHWDQLLDAGADRAALNASDAVATGDFAAYSSAELTVAMAGATDSGLTFGADFSVSVGRSYTLGDADSFGDNSGAFGMPTLWVDGSYGKISVSDDSYDFYDDTNGSGDVKYESTFGAVAVGLIADIDASEFSAKADYTNGNLAVSVNADTYELWNVSAAYTFTGITATIATDESSNSSLKVAYASGPITASAQYNTSDASMDLVAGLANNGMSLNFDYNTVSANYNITLGYDLGGGLSLEAGTNYTNDVKIGVAMAF